jgi:hypothetical protein
MATASYDDDTHNSSFDADECALSHDELIATELADGGGFDAGLQLPMFRSNIWVVWQN